MDGSVTPFPRPLRYSLRQPASRVPLCLCPSLPPCPLSPFSCWHRSETSQKIYHSTDIHLHPLQISPQNCYSSPTFLSLPPPPPPPPCPPHPPPTLSSSSCFAFPHNTDRHGASAFSLTPAPCPPHPRPKDESGEYGILPASVVAPCGDDSTLLSFDIPCIFFGLWFRTAITKKHEPPTFYSPFIFFCIFFPFHYFLSFFVLLFSSSQHSKKIRLIPSLLFPLPSNLIPVFYWSTPTQHTQTSKQAKKQPGKKKAKPKRNTHLAKPTAAQQPASAADRAAPIISLSHHPRTHVRGHALSALLQVRRQASVDVKESHDTYITRRTHTLRLWAGRAEGRRSGSNVPLPPRQRCSVSEKKPKRTATHTRQARPLSPSNATDKNPLPLSLSLSPSLSLFHTLPWTDYSYCPRNFSPSSLPSPPPHHHQQRQRNNQANPLELSKHSLFQHNRHRGKHAPPPTASTPSTTQKRLEKAIENQSKK
eukprot:Rhum_TRINITY_DN12653_c2_g1::Rhum_TRINITY_DN12653_c2_g1_i2::g.53465::m.53465